MTPEEKYEILQWRKKDITNRLRQDYESCSFLGFFPLPFITSFIERAKKHDNEVRLHLPEATELYILHKP